MRACVIGLDCLEPSLVERWIGDLPTFAALRRAGVWGTMGSCVPPITVPAWSCMMSSRDPGALGIYGFRNRIDYSYAGLGFATSEWVHSPRVWDLLAAQGKTSALIGVPGTYPVKPIRGWAIGDFMTPSDAAAWTHPPELRADIDRWLDGAPYLFDVADFRSPDKARILADIREMTRRRFRVAREMLREKAPDFFMMVEMGSDRIHHAFWHHSDPQHRKHEAGGPFAAAIHDYYVQLDQELAALLKLIDLRETSVLVISDHGAKRLDGGICVNEWLRREGLLVLRSEPPAAGTPLQKCDVDWSRTTAWAEGGYYARIFLNVVGREPQGIVQPADYETTRGEIGHRLARIPDHRGQPLATAWHRPQKLYPRVEGIAPDLIVIFADLHWRAVGSLGFGELHTFENDTGPDEANHAELGYFSWTAPGLTPSPKTCELDILDVAPTLLRQLGVPFAPGMQGQPRDFAPAAPKASLAAPASAPDEAGERYTEQQQAEIEQRLAALGYLGIMSRRVVVLGLDGVPDWLLRQLAAEGVMPHAARLLAQGDLRAMETVYPPLSSVSWTTFATGVNPGRHRIFGFFEFQTDGHRLWYQDAQDVKMPSLWDYAQAHGRRTVSINLPGTYPARPLNGVMISGFMARDLPSSVYPRLLLPHLEKLGYRLDVDCDQPQANAERFFANAHAALSARAHTMAAFLEHEPWDLFIGVFTETDRVQHYFFDALLEPHHPEFERVRRFYRAVDEALGRCLAKVRDEDELILLADHGFCRIEQEVFLNTWLAEHGYLTPAEPGPDGRRAVFNPARTVAFSLDTGRVFLNVRGRQPEGCVAPEDAPRLREEIAAGLEKLAIRVPWSAQPFRPVSRVFRREEIYRGPFTALGGDLILHPVDGYELKSSFHHPALSGLRNFTGMHTFDRASLFIRGRKWPERTPRIIDLASAILRLMQLPVPDELEGLT